jgi:ATP-dependent helicase/nuclease subunit A
VGSPRIGFGGGACFGSAAWVGGGVVSEVTTVSAATAAAAPVDAEVRQLISDRGLERTLFVEAGAGTGKTTQLVERITNLVLERDVRLRGIAAITFTEAAASELADRIRVAFERREMGTDDPVAARRCREAVADADLAAISTLHGFAKRILGEHPLAAGLPPRIVILDEVSSELAREARWDRFLDALYDDPANEELLARAVLTDAALEPRYQGHATMKDVAVELGQNWDRLDAVADQQHGPLAGVDFSVFDDAVAALAELPGRCSDPADKFYENVVCRVLPSVQAISDQANPELKLRALCGSGDWSAGRGGKKGAWGGDFEGAKAVLARVNEARSEVKRTVANDVLARLLTLVAGEVRQAAEERRAEGQLEFHDLLVLCRRLLRNDPHARAQLHERYTHLLLDEFQDTDPIQIELAVLIAASIESDPADSGPAESNPATVALDDGSAWRSAQVDEGRLFFVGDPKQSIYRFRRADIELFLEARDRFGPDGTWLRLQTNFRTVPDVLAWVNGLFSTLMPEEIPGRQPQYSPLAAHRSASPTGDHRPVMLGGPHPKVSAGELRELEAVDVADTIAAIRRTPEEWPVFDPETSSWRPARLADVTVLVPTRTSLPYLRTALSEARIPYRLDTGTLVYDTQEIRDALAALRAIDDPTDELSLVTALRSPLYACADTDLFTYRHASGGWDLRAAAPDDLSGEHPVVLALAHLRSLWEQRWWLGPSALLDRLLADRQAFLLAFGDDRPKEVWGRLRFLLDQARAFEEAGGGTLRLFLEWAALQSSSSARVHEPLLPETDDPSVRIMTVHGAKGLEFPITVLSGMTTKPGNQRKGVSVLWNPDGTPEVKIRKDVATSNHDPRADIEAEMDVHEKLRLLYVAATRARDHLVVACHHNDGDESYAGVVWRRCDAPDAAAGWRRPPAAEALVPATVPPVSAPGAAVSPVSVASASVASAPGAGVLVLDGGASAVGGAWAGAATDEAELDDREPWMAAREALLAPQRQPRFVSATAIAAEADNAVVRGPGHDGDSEPDDLLELDGLFNLEDIDGPSAEGGVAEGGVADGGVAEGGVVAGRRRGRAGTAIGRAVHATLQLVDLGVSAEIPTDEVVTAPLAGSGVVELTLFDTSVGTGAPPPSAVPARAGIDVLAARQAGIEGISEHAATVAAMTRSALSSAAVGRAKQRRYHKEMYVSAPVGTRVIEGYVDLLIEDDDGLVIVDYKTDAVASAAHVDAKMSHYELQGAAYAVALEESTGLPVVGCHFVFCRPDGAIERRVTDLEAAKARVRRHLGGL